MADSAPNYHRLEAEILSVDIPTLEIIGVMGQHRYPLLIDEMELRRCQGLRRIKLVVELGHRGEGEDFIDSLYAHLVYCSSSLSSIMGAEIVGDRMA